MTTGGVPTSLPRDPVQDMDPLSGTPIGVHYSPDPTWQRLISNAVPQDELASFVETVFSKENITDLVDSLQGAHVQTFIDVIDVVRNHTLRSPEDGLIDSA